MVEKSAFHTRDGRTTARRFVWTARLPIKRVADQRTPITPGTYRLVATATVTTEGECPGEVCMMERMTVVSSAFTVSAP